MRIPPMIGKVYMIIGPGAVGFTPGEGPSGPNGEKRYHTPMAMLTAPRAKNIIRFVAGLARNHSSSMDAKSRKNLGAPIRYGVIPG